MSPTSLHRSLSEAGATAPSAIASPVAAPQAASQAASCAATLAILLAGQSQTTRHAQLSTSLGLPTAALPINGERNLVECLIRRMVDAGFRGTMVLALASEAERAFYANIVLPAQVDAGLVRLEVRVDTAGHRGAGGTVGDVWADVRREACARDATVALESVHAGGVIVIEASTPPNFELARFLAAIDPAHGALIGAALDLTPAGVVWVSREAVALVPAIGFFDLKEQLVPAIVASGRSVHACVGSEESCRIVDRETYLHAVALMRAAGAEQFAADAVIEPGARVRGDSIVCRGAVVERGALVVDAAVLPGARVCADAVVARSIVPPGSHVPRGYLVVDEVFGALGSAAKSGTEGGAS